MKNNMAFEQILCERLPNIPASLIFMSLKNSSNPKAKPLTLKSNPDAGMLGILAIF